MMRAMRFYSGFKEGAGSVDVRGCCLFEGDQDSAQKIRAYNFRKLEQTIRSLCFCDHVKAIRVSKVGD